MKTGLIWAFYPLVGRLLAGGVLPVHSLVGLKTLVLPHSQTLSDP